MGCRCAGLTTGKAARRGDRCRDRSSRPHTGRTRLHAPRPSGSVRHRRHGVPKRPPGHCPARAAGRKVRRQGDSGATRWRHQRRAIQVFRQRHHGHNRSNARRRAFWRNEFHRHHRLSDVGVHSRLVSDWLGQPVRHPVLVGPLALVHEESSAPHHHARSGDRRDRCSRFGARRHHFI